MKSRSLSNASRTNHHILSVEELWRQFFSDPSQWWDHTTDKGSPKHPDFIHKKTGVGLWLDKRSNPSWLKTELASMSPGSASTSLYSWNAMLSRCVKSDQGKDALELYNKMQAEAIKPDKFIFVTVLKACASLVALDEGRRVHKQVTTSGWDSDVFVGSSLVDMYAKCGSIADAERVFYKMPTRNVVTWSSMLAGYVNCEQGYKALELFRQMQAEQVKADPVSFALVLKACASIMALEDGKDIHTQVIQNGCESDVLVGNSLVNMYAKCRSIADAERVFHRMPNRNVVSWGAMLSGYVNCEEESKALELFQKMRAADVKVNPVIFASVLKACASAMALEEGRCVHAHVIESGCASDVLVGSILVDMYAKCGHISDAERVFNEMATRSVVSWCVMLSGYVNCEEGQKALDLYQKMQAEGMKPNSLILASVLKACASIISLEDGKRVHVQVIESGCESDVLVGNSLVNMYAKCGSIADAERVFQRMPMRNVASWGAMVAGYVTCEEGLKALELFQQMEAEDVKANSVIFVSLLKACAGVMALEEGQRVHACVIESGCESDVFVGSTLVAMYAKCGSILDAQRVFYAMPTIDVISANAMLGGYAMHGLGKEALQLFQAMHQVGVEIDTVTVISLLSACSHGGFVEEEIMVMWRWDSA